MKGQDDTRSILPKKQDIISVLDINSFELIIRKYNLQVAGKKLCTNSLKMLFSPTPFTVNAKVCSG